MWSACADVRRPFCGGQVSLHAAARVFDPACGVEVPFDDPRLLNPAGDEASSAERGKGRREPVVAGKCRPERTLRPAVPQLKPAVATQCRDRRSVVADGGALELYSPDCERRAFFAARCGADPED